jgi:hypothetical protein
MPPRLLFPGRSTSGSCSRTLYRPDEGVVPVSRNCTNPHVREPALCDRRLRERPARAGFGGTRNAGQRDRLREELTLAPMDRQRASSTSSTCRASWRSQSAFYGARRTCGCRPPSNRSRADCSSPSSRKVCASTGNSGSARSASSQVSVTLAAATRAGVETCSAADLGVQ